MECACDSVFELDGNAAVEYAREHLDEVAIDHVDWLIHYRCSDTGRLWVRDYPHGELHGGGPPRLRQRDAAGEPVG